MNEYIKYGKDFGIDWNYILTKEVEFNFGKFYVPVDFRNKWLWIRIENGELICTVSKDYAWDGPTAVPDFDGTVLASVIHDAIYQFAEDIARAFGWSVWKTLGLADSLFNESMKKTGTKTFVRIVYFAGVKIVGYPFHMIAKLFR